MVYKKNKHEGNKTALATQFWSLIENRDVLKSVC